MQQQSQTASQSSHSASTSSLVQMLKERREALETEKASCKRRLKEIAAELDALPKLPKARKPRAKKNGSAEQGK